MRLKELELELFGVRCTLRQYEPRVARYTAMRLAGSLRGEEATRAAFVFDTVTRLQAQEASLVKAIENEREAERQRREISGYGTW